MQQGCLVATGSCQGAAHGQRSLSPPVEVLRHEAIDRVYGGGRSSRPYSSERRTVQLVRSENGGFRMAYLIDHNGTHQYLL
jgi:hypothetical protein